MSFIETERLLIRTWMPSDVPALAAILGDAETMRYIGPGHQHGLTAEQTKEAVAAMTQAYERDGIGIWPAVLKETGELVGECGLQTLPGSSDVELVYVIAKIQRGNGLAYEAASAVMAFGFAEQRLPRIVAVVHPFNVPAIRLVNRLGMRFDRVARVYKADLLKYVKERT